MISIICWDLEPRINAIGWSTCCTPLTMTKWCIPVTGCTELLWVMYRDQCHWMLWLTRRSMSLDEAQYMNISNYVCPAHISTWDAFHQLDEAQLHVFNHTEWDVNYNDHQTKSILHIYNWLCVVHPSYWDVPSDINHLLIWWAFHQCYWMKHMLHVFNHDWRVNPSNWGAPETINYVLGSMSLDEPHNWHL